jgi:hypothetical protein
MSIKIGSTDINELQIGPTHYESVYVGADKVFSRPLLLDITVGYQPVSSGTDEYGYNDYDFTSTVGALNYAQSQPNANWFQGRSLKIINWQDYFNSGTGRVRIYFNNWLNNSDTNFTTLKINNLVLNRTDANFYVFSNFASWTWEVNTNPWSGTGNIDRVRFERNV